MPEQTMQSQDAQETQGGVPAWVPNEVRRVSSDGAFDSTGTLLTMASALGVEGFPPAPAELKEAMAKYEAQGAQQEQQLQAQQQQHAQRQEEEYQLTLQKTETQYSEALEKIRQLQQQHDAERAKLWDQMQQPATEPGKPGKPGKPEEPTEQLALNPTETKTVDYRDTVMQTLQDVAERYREQGGKLFERDYQELASKGISREFVMQYQDGMKSKDREEAREILKVLPDGVKISDIEEWAVENLPEEIIEDYNQVMVSGNTFAKKAAVDHVFGLKQAQEGGQGSQGGQGGTNPPARRVAGGAAPQGPEGYKSLAEYGIDMESHEYKTNPEYKARVDAKAARSFIQ